MAAAVSSSFVRKAFWGVGGVGGRIVHKVHFIVT